jgi:hypothetical protein
MVELGGLGDAEEVLKILLVLVLDAGLTGTGLTTGDRETYVGDLASSEPKGTDLKGICCPRIPMVSSGGDTAPSFSNRASEC